MSIPFERIEEKRNRNIEGTGLGMNITMQLLALLDSKLSIKSEYGVGSEFSFVLSQEIINPEPTGKFEEQITDLNNAYDYQTYFEAPEAKILVVDDNEMNRKVFCSLLKDTKIQIDEAASGKECIEKVKKSAFHIIFMDHMMPEMDGIETFKVMKTMEDYPNKDTPVIILTANAIVGAKEQYLAEGFQAFLSKPIDFRKLEKLIVEVLDKTLVHYVNKSVLQEEISVNTSELPMIDGLDWGYAATHFKNEEMMLKTVKLFADSIEYEAKNLEALYLEHEQAEGRKKYCTKVHSMKSSAALIGIVNLAGMAMELEKAARGYKTDVIRAMHPVFSERWNSYYEVFGEIVSSGEDLKNASDYMDEINEIFSQIRCGAENMDVDVLDEMSKLLDEYNFDKPLADKVEMVKMWILNFELEKLVDCSL